MTFFEAFERTVLIDAPVTTVWEYLTTPSLMRSWMGEASMQLEVQTSWEIGQPITITGVHHLPFENKGMVTQFQPPQILQYTHLSSLSRLADKRENYSTISFYLSPQEQQSLLLVRVDQFPTETIYRHLLFYWQGTLGVLKRHIEKPNETKIMT